MVTKKLYQVEVRGFQSDYGSPRVDYRWYYVVATDPTVAYQMARKFLDKNKIGFTKDRELASIKLLAEQEEYPDCGTILCVDDADFKPS